MNPVIIDFETYYDGEISVRTMGNANYVAATDAYIVGYADTSTGECEVGTIAELGDKCEQIAKDPTVLPVAANSNFDQAWWEKYYPGCQRDWHCVLDQARFHQFPSDVASLSGVVLGQKADKSVRDKMKGVVYETMTEEGQLEVCNYCLEDVQHEAEIYARLKPMTDVEARIAQHTRMVNRRGVAVDLERARADKDTLVHLRHEQITSLPWYEDAAPLSIPAFKLWCRGQGITPPGKTDQKDPQCIALRAQHPAMDKVLTQMSTIRVANALIGKIESLEKRVTPDGILPLDLLFAGAPHTRRWSSRGFNVQNLSRFPWEFEVGGEMTSVWSRPWLVPRPGKRFLIVDFAQIEPRCLNWQVGNEEMLDAMRKGLSYYEAYSAANPVYKWRGEPGTLKQELGKAGYTLRKNEALGCGYGMGSDRFKGYVAGFGLEITDEQAVEAVKAFREGNPLICSFWKELQGWLLKGMADKQRTLEIPMPSGDILKYWALRATHRGHQGFKIKNDFSFNSTINSLWGGTMCENFTQRMARDVMAEAILRLEDAGFPVIFHAHDEVIIEVDIPSSEQQAKQVEDDVYRLMRISPDWAPDLPLDVEGSWADHYTKD